MKTNSFTRAVKVMALVYGTNATISKHLGIEERTFRICRGKSDRLSRSARHRYIVGARAVFLRLLLMELRKSGALSDESIRNACKSINSKLNKNAA